MESALAGAEEALAEEKPRSSGELAQGIAHLVALASLAVPLAAVRWPLLLDYPNHYTRMWLLSGGATLPPVAQMYQVVWNNTSTNIAIDVAAASLGKMLPVSAVGPLLLALALALPPLGAARLNRALFGGSHWWQVAVVSLAWSATLVAGFLNFQIGLGLALLCASLDPWLSAKGRGAAAAGRLCAGALILGVHAFAFVFYPLLIGALALGADRAPLSTAPGAARRVGQAALAALPALVPLALMALLAPRLPGAHVTRSFVEWQSWRKVGQAMLTPFATYQLSTDGLFAAALLAPLAWAAATRRIRGHAGLLACAAGLALISNVMPVNISGTAWIDKRLPAMAVLAFAAAVRPQIAASGVALKAALALALATSVGRSLWVSNVWAKGQGDVESMERALAAVPSGAAVLPLEHRPSPEEIRRAPLGRYILRSQPTYWHLPTLAVVERRAFVPGVFTAAGKQPLRVLPPWDELAVPEGDLPSVELLGDPRAAQAYPYLARWKDQFDYLLVLNADLPNQGGPLPAGAPVERVAQEGFAELYRVLKPDRAPQAIPGDAAASALPPARLVAAAEPEGKSSADGGRTGAPEARGRATAAASPAATPPMGWSSWNKFGCNVSEELVKKTADAMVSSGMAAAGYRYVNIDDCWQLNRDGEGNIVPNPGKFPSGMRALADYAHARGLKLGLYTDRGTLTCQGHPGSQGHEVQDARAYAGWGVDYVKVDNCNADSTDSVAQAQFTAMGAALREAGRPIVYSICAWAFKPWMPSVGNLWRTTRDISDNWTSFTSILDENARLAEHASPGHWNDPDMLEVGNGGMSDAEYRAHFSLWAIMAAPLIAGNDLVDMPESTRAILTNSEVIAVDQDPLGVQGTRVKQAGPLEVWSKVLSGEKRRAVVLFNRGEKPAEIAAGWADLGLQAGPAAVRDLWAHRDLGAQRNRVSARVPPHSAVMLTVDQGPAKAGEAARRRE